MVERMNNRIQQLAEQCGFRSNPDIYDRNQSFDIPKFAELIVRECILTIQMGISRDGHNTEKYLQSMKHLKQIKEHFGVKE